MKARELVTARLHDEFLLRHSLIKLAIVFAVFMTTLAYLQWVERKVLAPHSIAHRPAAGRPARPDAAARGRFQAI